MLPFRISLDVGSVLDSADRLRHALDDQVFEAMRMISEDVAAEARQSHPYTNRTGDLEASTQAVDVNGTFSLGTLVGGVSADTSYAEYVDGRPEFAFLEPAFQRVEPHVDQILESAILAAAGQAGW